MPGLGWFTRGDGQLGLVQGVSLQGENVTVSDSSTEYETVAASQTAQVIGAAGAAGDYMLGLLIIPATLSPGAVTLLDGATSIPVFVGGANSITSLIPFFVPISAKCVGAGWKVTTGASVSVLATGNFS